jgi:hypothetical protein
MEHVKLDEIQTDAERIGHSWHFWQGKQRVPEN